jgi:hypothetical protein
MSASAFRYSQTLVPSFLRAVRSTLTVVALPLLLLSVISLCKLVSQAGWVELVGPLQALVNLQERWLVLGLDRVADLGLRLPPWVVDVFVVYLFPGAAIVHSERHELLAIEIDPGHRLATLREGLTTPRLDSLFMGIPMPIRPWFLRVVWPLVLVHRLRTPYIVEGPGPGGDEISSSVPSGEIAEFIDMANEGTGGLPQTVFDQRQVIVWALVISAATAALFGTLSATLPVR